MILHRLVESAYEQRLKDYENDSNNPAWVLRMHAIVATLKEMFDVGESGQQEYLDRLKSAVEDM